MERAPDNPWPQFPRVFKVDYGHAEASSAYGADPREFCILSKEFIGENGTLTGVKTVRVEWTKDDRGAWRMQEVAGSEKIFKADLILLSMGFMGPENDVLKQLSVKQDARTNIATPKGSYRTFVEGVFAAGGEFLASGRSGDSEYLLIFFLLVHRLPERPVAYRLGHQRGSPGRARDRHLPHGQHPSAGDWRYRAAPCRVARGHEPRRDRHEQQEPLSALLCSTFGHADFTLDIRTDETAVNVRPRFCWQRRTLDVLGVVVWMRGL